VVIQFQTVADAATAALRELIVNGELVEDTPLRQDELAERLGISRTPLREAITRLAAEGLVRTDRYKGAIVRRPTAAELREVYEIREVLECFAGRLATEHVTPEDVDALDRVLNAFERASSTEEWARLNTRFHMDMYAISGRSQLVELISTMRNRSEFYVRVLVTSPGRADKAEQDHREILAALEKRDADEVERAIREHLRHTVEAVTDALNETPTESRP
jgi:DNA-binding GntR family transcriptional regulator